jgi:hypothetical protein
MRGLLPSLPVEKFALFMPPPSWASAFTRSLAPKGATVGPRPYWLFWKLPADSVNP